MPSLGDILQEARKKKGLSREEAAKALRMKAERLCDLEEGRYERFSAYVYVRGFVRHYADYLGIDTGAILERFAEENPPPNPKPIFEITEEQQSHSPIQRHVPARNSLYLTTTGKTVLIAVLVILFSISAMVWWIIHRQSQASKLSSNFQITSENPPMIFTTPESIQNTRPVAPLPSPPLTLSTNQPPAEAHRAP